MKPFFRFVLLFLVTLISSLGSAVAQTSDTTQTYVWPPELYSGENELTISSANGLHSITAANIHEGNMEFEEEEDLSCRKVYRMRIFVRSVSIAQGDTIVLVITDCADNREIRRIGLAKTWTLDRIDFGNLREGDTACRQFHIQLTNIGLVPAVERETLDDVTVNDDNVSIDLPTSLPYSITTGMTYRYQVCYVANDPGRHDFPVITWMRRRYPSAGKTSYAIADTGTVFVIANPVTDPTTFRSVAVPNAIIPPKGSIVAGSYDLLGLMAGYSFTDNIMLLAGGALPTPDDWGGINKEMFGAYSIGLKAGVALGKEWNVAVGYQWGRSIYDQQGTPETESTITLGVPWGSVSYGDDDSRISATFGYAFKHHERPLAIIDQEFDRQAAIIALGGDYRFARNWKIAGEVASMETLGIVPIVATMRYFTNRYAIDFGMAYVGLETEVGAAPKIPLVPVVSGVIVF